MPERPWKVFLEKHRGEVDHIARRTFDDGTGTIYIRVRGEVFHDYRNSVSGKCSRCGYGERVKIHHPEKARSQLGHPYYHSFEVKGGGKRTRV